MKITIIGNSGALRVRPPQRHPKNRNFTYLLRSKLPKGTMVENKALGATTIIDWLKAIDTITQSFPDILIVQIGVVDATIREVPQWFYRLANRKVDTIFSKVMKWLYRGPISKMRPHLSRLRGSRSWVSPKQFERRYDQLIATILKETNARVIIMPINIANNRIENQLPGSQANHKRFNEIIRSTATKYSQNFIDISDLSSKEHFPDGVHFNVAGHKIVSERLVSLINKIGS